jgi:hypothetical protein
VFRHPEAPIDEKYYIKRERGGMARLHGCHLAEGLPGVMRHGNDRQ